MTAATAAAALLLLLLCGCRAPRRVARNVIGIAKIRATVVTVQTTIQPANKSFTHTIVIGSGRARSLDELDQWRLYDMGKKQVTFVDEIAHTYRTDSLNAILARRRAAMAQEPPFGAPHPQLTTTSEKRVIAGIPASQTTIRIGRYVRDLWIGAPAAIPQELFSMMQASEPASSSFAPMMRSIDQAMLNLRGFPLAEHAQVPVGNKNMSVDRTVVKIETQDVPETLLNVPPSYKDVTPTPPPPRKR